MLTGAPSPAGSPVALVTIAGDYNGVGKTNPAVFTRGTATAALSWIVENPATGATTTSAQGQSNIDVPVSGDFNGSGKTDLAYYRFGTGQWYAQLPARAPRPCSPPSAGRASISPSPPTTTATARPTSPPTGRSPARRPTAPGASATPTPSAPSLPARSSPAIIQPAAGDVAVPGNYDGVGHAELAIFRPSTGLGEISGAGPTRSSTPPSFVFGAGRERRARAASYDATATSHTVEAAVFNTGNGKWFVRTSASTEEAYQFNPGDIPAPGDYLGTGVTEPAVYRPSTHQWLYVDTGGTTPVVIPGSASFGAREQRCGEQPVLLPPAFPDLHGHDRHRERRGRHRQRGPRPRVDRP